MRFWKRPLLASLVLSLLLIGCDPQPTSRDVVPTGPERLLGLLEGDEEEVKYALVKDPLLPGVTQLSISQIIGVEGGSLSLLGHTLTVPAGAVDQPTLFTLTVLPSGYVEVDLSAVVESLLGLIDVGSSGFKKRVPISLTYSRATNVSNPKKLLVARIHSLVGYDDLEPLPSKVNTKAETVTAELDHFSRYAMVFPY